MPAGQIRVTPEQLASVASQLNGGAGSIDGILSQLAGNVAPLGSDWAGVAQGRFLQLWEQADLEQAAPPGPGRDRRADAAGLGRL